jgi:hypothetical protein
MEIVGLAGRIGGETGAKGMDAEQSGTPELRWFHPTPGQLLVVLLAVEGILYLSEQWFPKGWAVLTAIAAVGLFLLLMGLWYILALFFRWRFQFSLRSLLVLTFAVAIPFSWLAVEMKWAREQREAVETLTKDGKNVLYDVEFDKSAYSPALVWMRKQLGDDFFRNVQGLDLSNTKVSDVGAECLKGLTQLQGLTLWNTKVSDIGVEHLKGLTQLHGLNLSHTRVSDVGVECLKGLTQLQSLDLSNTKVSDVGVERLKGLTQLQWLGLGSTEVSDVGVECVKGLTQLQGLDLSNTKVSDVGVEYLKGLTQLQALDLSNTKVTDAGVAKLQKALPNCKIYRRNANSDLPDRREKGDQSNY